MQQLIKLNDDAQILLAMQQIHTHNEPVSNVEGNPAFQVLSPPPSSFGGFSAIPRGCAFFWSLRNAHGIGLTHGHFPNKITRFRQVHPTAGNVHENPIRQGP